MRKQTPLVELDKVIRLLENLPPDAIRENMEPARWVWFPPSDPYCSYCREYSHDAKMGRGNYCPNCGRPMENP